MNGQTDKIIVGAMASRSMGEWKISPKRTKRLSKRTLIYVSVVVFCLSVSTYAIFSNTNPSQHVISVMSTGFEYDETLGRLQYVSNILPESAMVFLSGDNSQPEFLAPSSAQVLHAWSQDEPWIEFDQAGEIQACDAGEVVNVVKNRENEYTVRLMHEGEYESVYSGLNEVFVDEFDVVDARGIIGSSVGTASFELRKAGMSILPVFSGQGE